MISQFIASLSGRKQWLLRLGAIGGCLLILSYVIINVQSFNQARTHISKINQLLDEGVPELVSSIYLNLWQLDEIADTDGAPYNLKKTHALLGFTRDNLVRLHDTSRIVKSNIEYEARFDSIYRAIDETEAMLTAYGDTPDIRERIRDRFNLISRNFNAIGIEALHLQQGDIRSSLQSMREHEQAVLFGSGIFVALGCGMILFLVIDMLRREELLRKAIAAERMKSSFFAMMSHEIRTPINGILGMLTLLGDTQLNEAQQNCIHTAQTSAESLLTIINDVLDYSKIEAGKLEIEYSQFSVRDLLGSITELLQPLARSKDLELQSIVAADVPESLCADPVRVRQIMLNFASNAIKFTEKGFVRIDVTRETRPHNGVNASFVRFSVTDSGIGIGEDAKNRLFKEFSQVDGSYARRFAGTGLGLAICKSLAEMMRGNIGFISALGKGSTFWFAIPLLAEAGAEKLKRQAAASPPEIKEPSMSAPIRILLAEDNQTNLIIAISFLQKGGHTVDAATNGAEAVELARHNKYDMVLTDISMPVMDGFEATRQIRGLSPHYSRVPIIAMTAHAMAEDREACFKAGMNDHISKPLARDVLLAMVAKWAGQEQAAPSTPAVAEARQPAAKPQTGTSHPKPEPVADTPEIDDSYFRQIITDLGVDGVQNFAEVFINDIIRTGAALMEAARNNQWTVVKISAHSMKSSAMSFGLSRLSGLAAEIERQCKQSSKADDATIAKWPEYQARAIETLKKQLNAAGIRAS